MPAPKALTPASSSAKQDPTPEEKPTSKGTPEPTAKDRENISTMSEDQKKQTITRSPPQP